MAMSIPSAGSEIGSLLVCEEAARIEQGYGHTLREICQQPETWIATSLDNRLHTTLRKALDAAIILGSGRGAIVLTGSGSSQYVGECVAIPLQHELGISVTAAPSGLLLTHAPDVLPPRERLLVVSIARSGNSPESLAVQQRIMREAPQAHHLVLTCNAAGKLAMAHPNHPQVHVALLDERTNVRSLVMTSSFTNLTLAGRMLGWTGDWPAWQTRAAALAEAGRRVIESHSDALARAARLPFRSVVFLGSGCHVGAAREGALKMLEMTAGRVWTMVESFLGFRHGPMSAVANDTLVVALLSSDPIVRAYELDLLRELDRKILGLGRIIAGTNVPAETASGRDSLAIDYTLPEKIHDADLPVLHVLVSQLLGFFRCLHEKLRPDMPSESGVINRVVESFRIYDSMSSRSSSEEKAIP